MRNGNNRRAQHRRTLHSHWQVVGLRFQISMRVFCRNVPRRCCMASHSINKCTLFLRVSCVSISAKNKADQPCGMFCFCSPMGTGVYPDIKIKSILEVTSKSKKQNPAHRGTHLSSYKTQTHLRTQPCSQQTPVILLSQREDRKQPNKTNQLC